MAEIDHIKALAGLLVLDDEDDDLFLSSPIARPDIDNFLSNNYINKSPFGKSVSTVEAADKSIGDHIRRGVVKNQQHDEILLEMQRKGFVGENSARNNTENSQTNSSIAKEDNSDDANKTVFKTTHHSLSIGLDEPCAEKPTTEDFNSKHDTDQLIFGRPQTFGAAGGYETNYMPNVKQRAVAISAWKILEMQKEKKNGHARAREWKVGDEREEDYERRRIQTADDATEKCVSFVGNENHSVDNGRKNKIPSFLTHFDNAKHTNGDEENSVNGVACQLNTPRSGAGVRVPLSPRVNDMSARNVGVSPRNVLSPQNIILSPREALLKMEASRCPSPRNMIRECSVFSPRDGVLSPRNKSLISQGRANKADHGGVGSSSFARSHKVNFTTVDVMPSNKIATNKKSQMSTNGVGVMQDLTSVLDRCVFDSAVDSSVSKPNVRVTSSQNGKEVTPPLAINQDDQQEKNNNDMSKIERNKSNDSREFNPYRFEKPSGTHGEADKIPLSALDEKIHDILEEASRLLQNAEQASDMPKEGSVNVCNDNEGVDFKFDEQLLSAAELARALDKFLVEDDSMEDEAFAENLDEALSTGDMNSNINLERKLSSDCGALIQANNHPESNLELDASSEAKMVEHEKATESKQLNRSNPGDTKESDLTFPTDFEDLTCDQLTSNLATSFDDAFFPVAFENTQGFVQLDSQPTRSCDASTPALERKRKLPNIKISIEGAPTFKVDDNGMNKASPMFFFSQPSPNCGDNASLVQTHRCLDTPEDLFNGKAKKESTKKMFPLNNPTKRLDIKKFISHTFPTKDERDNDGLSPSMAGLLKMDHTAAIMEMDENVGFVSVHELAKLTPKASQSEHFFVGAVSSPTTTKAGRPRKAPSSPITFCSSVRTQTHCVSSMNKYSTPERDKKKKNGNASIFQRIKSPLLSGKKLVGVGWNDDSAFGRL